MNLADILKDSDYKLSQFTSSEIEQLEQTITLKETKSGKVPYTICLVRQKAIKLTPDEAIRQLYLRVLTVGYQCPLPRHPQFEQQILSAIAPEKLDVLAHPVLGIRRSFFSTDTDFLDCVTNARAVSHSHPTVFLSGLWFYHHAAEHTHEIFASL